MNPFRPPPWMSALAVFRLRTLMMSLAIFAVVLALIAQGRRAAEREKELRVELSQAKSKAWREEEMRAFLGDLGVVILKDSKQVELLQVGRLKGNQPYSRAPTGKVFGREFADRIARVMLDINNYAYFDDWGLPKPQAGLRLRRGQDSMDILFSLEGSSGGSAEQNIWVFVNPGHGDNLKIERSERCFYDPDLGKLLSEIKAD